MNQVQIIKPVETPSIFSDHKTHRVCAYCRVSTDEMDQVNSLESQRRFFSRYFEKRSNWINVGIFADDGLSGTSLAKRDSFNTMIKMARQSKIDLILTKEVSRFSRNVQDLLNIVVELRNRGVYIWFLSDDISTDEDNYREKLTQIATNAEQESLRTSRRVKWGHQQQMQRGVAFGRRKMFGYEIMRDTTGNQVFSVVPEEAEIIRQIFEWFSAGYGTHTIIKRLQQKDICTEHYQNGWSNNVILRILRNEKYVGDLLQGKTYTPDPLTHRKKYNHGEYYRYYIQNHHTPIIDRDLWDRVQAILKSNEPDDVIKAKHSNRYWCSGKIFCGICGRRYISITRKQKSIPYKAWNCIENNRWGNYKETTLITGEKKTVGCNSLRVNDRILKLAIHDIAELIIAPQKKTILAELEQYIRNRNGQSDYSKNVDIIIAKISRLLMSLDNLTVHLADNLITVDQYKRTKKLQEEKIADLSNQLNRLNTSINSDGIMDDYLDRCVAEMKKIIDLSDDALNEELFERMVRKIIVHPLNMIEIFLAEIPYHVVMQYKTYGKGRTYTASFVILTQEQFQNNYNGVDKHVLPVETSD